MIRLLAFPLAASLLAASATVAFARTPYDGNWSVLIMTQAGNCDTAYRYPLRIENGKVLYGGDSGFAVSGRVGSGGVVSVSISRGDSKASGSGRLTANAGAGKWTGGTPGANCSGRWQAERVS